MFKNLLIAWVIFYNLEAWSQVNLVNIEHSIIHPNMYKVSFSLDKKTSFEVLPFESQNRIAIDFYNTNYSVKTLPTQKLDEKFLKTIRRVTQHDQDLSMILELTANTKLHKYYFTKEANQLFVTIELKNDSLILPTEQKAKEKLRQYVIVIDPGHGGADAGTTGAMLETLEKNLVLSYAKALAKELAKYPQYKIFLTREKDNYLSMEDRQRKTHSMNADLLISLHADYNHDPAIHGATIYTLSQQAVKEDSLVLFEKENKTTALKNDQLLEQNKDIANLLINMVYADTLDASINLAKFTTEALKKTIIMLPKSHRLSSFKVLKGVDIPAILIELGYLSNPEEEKLLNSSEYRQKVIYGCAQGINEYIASLKINKLD